MIKRIYVHNFRCLENFDFKMENLPSSLLIGKNGSGKSTLCRIFDILQSIGRGINRVGQLVRPRDFAHGRTGIPIRIEIEVFLNNMLYQYILALELPNNFKELRVSEEELILSGDHVYSRKEAKVTFYKRSRNDETYFFVDWHLVALPIIQEQSEIDPIRVFRTWLSRMIILAPIPLLMTGESDDKTLEPQKDGSNFGNWFSGVLGYYPAAYTSIDRYLKNIIPDILDIRNESVGKEAKSMAIRFEAHDTQLQVRFNDLSDGEKCFLLCAVVIAANQSYGPLFCLWDEPDNYLSLTEVGHFIVSLRRAFKNGGQFLATSHNLEGIRKFSNENTFVMSRKNHLEPVSIRLLQDMPKMPDSSDEPSYGQIRRAIEA